jgi:hypothetical protein
MPENTVGAGKDMLCPGYHFFGWVHGNARVALQGTIDGGKAKNTDGGKRVGQREEQGVQLTSVGQVDGVGGQAAEQNGHRLLQAQQRAALSNKKWGLATTMLHTHQFMASSPFPAHLVSAGPALDQCQHGGPDQPGEQQFSVHRFQRLLHLVHQTLGRPEVYFEGRLLILMGQRCREVGHL